MDSYVLCSIEGKYTLVFEDRRNEDPPFEIGSSITRAKHAPCERSCWDSLQGGVREARNSSSLWLYSQGYEAIEETPDSTQSSEEKEEKMCVDPDTRAIL